MTGLGPTLEGQSWRIERLESGNTADFFRLHSPANESGWCFCTAWWHSDWETWGSRTAEQNLAVRKALLEREIFDGYLMYAEDQPVGWCQALPRDQLPKLARQFNLPPDPAAWAVSCFLIAPAYRRQGAAAWLLGAVLDDLHRRGAARVEAFPRTAPAEDAGELWTGPAELFRRAGFRLVQPGERRSVYVWEDTYRAD